MFAQSVVHLLTGDTQLTCSALNRHYSEMNPAVYIIVYIHNKLNFLYHINVIHNRPHLAIIENRIDFLLIRMVLYYAICLEVI